MKREDFLARVAAQLDRAGARSLARPVHEARPDPLAQEDLLARFCAELERVGGSTHTCESSAQLESELCAFLIASGARSGVSFGKSCFEPFGFERLFRDFAVQAWERGGESCAAKFRAAAADADVGISIAELGVAASGSMLFSASAARPRSVTLLPRSHVAILRAANVVSDLAAALRVLEQRGVPASSALFVTGPSRTSDIENDLTLGVHGPAAVNVFVLKA